MKKAGQVVFCVFVTMTTASSVFSANLETLQNEYENAKLVLAQAHQTATELCDNVEVVRALTKTENPEIKQACMAEIQEIVRVEKANGLSRREIMPIISPLMFQCNEKAQGATVTDLIQAQEQCIAALDSRELASATLLAAGNAYILENTQVINHIEAMDAEAAKQAALEADIARIQANTARMLREAEEILQNLAQQ